MKTDNKHIVVIEDDRALQKALQARLRHEGYLVETAEDGATALRLLREGSIDLILLDLRLPDMNGTQVLETLKAEGRPIPYCIVLTNDDTMFALSKVIDLGVTHYITKLETSIDEVMQLVREGLSQA